MYRIIPTVILLVEIQLQTTVSEYFIETTEEYKTIQNTLHLNENTAK